MITLPAFIECRDFKQLQKKLQYLKEHNEKATSQQSQLSKNIIEIYQSGKIGILEKQLLRSMKIINRLDEAELKWMDTELRIDYLTNKTTKQMHSDAVVLQNYLNKGNSLKTFLGLKLIWSRAVRKSYYITREVYVNGNPCNTPQSLKWVVNDLRLRQDFRILEQIWRSGSIVGNCHYLRYSFFKKTLLQVIDLITTIQTAEQVRREIQKTTNILIRPFEQTCRVAVGGKMVCLTQKEAKIVEYSIKDLIHHPT
ncbi:hypothetical protein [Poritiphilus flavus]|uniref:Uncharacterized protein n=1 Tax=Poritiphilus flavus TaxID=2697053 RepID=A0A6L9EC09_9FLAO|nr:hypothetical protein [Poritiphilus flavus]NAS12255.1 hypothetical protein [Poritiphilus flavus]